MNICEKCSKSVDSEFFSTNLPENGIILKLQGYYGGFDDPSDYSDMTVLICHDCSLELFRSIPKLQERKGCHYSRSDKKCCEFSWTQEDFESSFNQK
jgi:hypothetical protein